MKDWKLVELENLCDFKNGLWTGKTPPYKKVGVIRNTNFTKNGLLDESNIAYLDVEVKQYANRKLQPGDIILEKSGGGPKQPVGRVILFTISDGDFSFSNFTSLIRIKNPQVLISEYLHKVLHFFYISGITESMQKYSTNIRNLQFKEYKKIKVPLPPLSEQKQIVVILDEAFEGIDAAIANTEKNLANARELFDSYLNGIFTQKGEGWVEKNLGEICSIKHGFAFKGEFFTNEEADYILLTPGSFYESGGYRDQGGKTKYYLGDIPDEFILKQGDFLFAMTEQAVGLLGSSLMVPESDRFLHNQRLGLVEVVRGFQWYNDFFFHQFNTRGFRAAVQSSASGVKVRHTSPKKLSAISVCFPPTLTEQKFVANTLNKLATETQQLESIYQRKLEALKELKQSILEKAFTGELTGDMAKEVAETSKEIAA